ncbi:MAG TPA: hypothetical protein VFQ22_02525, partial [Longimicrobiales bacterium]|nr:hypothetical protein [Longimicrobiales bacterium]
MAFSRRGEEPPPKPRPPDGRAAAPDGPEADRGAPRAAYLARHERHERARAAAAARSLRLSNLRALTFVAGALALLAYDVLEPPREAAALAAVGLLVLVFAAQVRLHRRVRRQERREAVLAALAREGLLRLDRDWAALAAALPAAERAQPEPEPDHPYARDLDVLGAASLLRLAGPVTSERGRALLVSWLLAPAPPDEVRARQEAVRELAGAAELRAEVTALGRLAEPRSFTGIDALLSWAEGEPWILDRTWLRAASWVLPPLVLGGLLAQLLLGSPPWWILPALPQLAVLRRVSRWAGPTFATAAEGGSALRGLVPQLAILEERPWEADRLRSVTERLGRGERSAHARLRRLSRLLDTVESRRNAFYALLAPLLLLDAHLGVALDRWRAASGRSVRDWIEAAGEWEALAALATVAHDHPRWTYPAFVDADAPRAALRLEARALGHPLLHPDTCVRNDVTVGPPGTFLFVTGSNMSGKSTLLRAL